MSHWAAPLIGLPYAPGAAGPEAYDCLNLVQHVVRQRLGTELPTVEQVVGSGWHPVAGAPQAHDVILMESVTGRHIGILIEADGVLGCLHAEHSSGVVFQRLGDVLADGYHRHRVWRYDPARGPGAALMDIGELQDKNAQRGLLQVVGLVLTFYGYPGWALAVNIASGILIPIDPPKVAEQSSTSPTYSTALGGNQARLDQPIPRICGRHKVTPPFAAQPYMEYDAAGDQYYYALFAVGIGNHVIERALIDDTAISHFADVLVSQYLPPGTLPGTVLANVSTAPEVAGQDIMPGRYIGGFAACAPRKKVASIGIDVFASRGLGLGNDDGTMANLAVGWRVEIRELDNFGDALTAWTILATETKIAATTEVQRWSFRYTLPVAIRPEIRLARTTPRDNNIRALNDIQWSGMRAYLDEDAPLNPDTAHYEVVLRASEQLSGLSQRNISLIAQALVRTWHPDTGWGAEVATRNPAWWLADLWTNAVWGEGLADDRVDLQTLYELSLVWAARQDRFDFVFDATMDAWEAAQMIARAGRARVFRRGGVHTLARDSLVTLPVTAYTPRNTVPDSMAMSEALPTRDAADGVIIEFFDNREWAWTPTECPAPGVGEMVNPVRKRLAGITGPIHARREGLYEAASLLYRRRTVRCTTEMQGVLPAFMSAIRWQPEILGYGQSGDVVSWDAGTLTMGLSEPVATAGNHLTLIRDDGTLTTPAAVSPGANENEVVLPSAPDFTLVLDDGTRERPKYILGPLDTCDELVKINAISDGGKSDGGVQLFDIEAIVDDARVHAADNSLLPGPGDNQDPVDLQPGFISPELYFVNLVESNGNTPQGNLICQRIFNNDGTAQILVSNNVTFPDILITLADEWLMNSPVEVEGAAEFEIYVTATFQPSAPATLSDGSSALDTWLNLGTSRNYAYFNANMGLHVDLAVQIREVSTGIVQDAATLRIVGGIPIEGGG